METLHVVKMSDALELSYKFNATPVTVLQGTRVCVCVCVCLCMRERERERARACTAGQADAETYLKKKMYENSQKL